MGKFSFGKWLWMALFAVLIIGCDKRKPPEVIENPRPPDEAPQHIITEFIYAQFTWGREGDSVTMQEPDGMVFGLEGFAGDSVYVNFATETQNVSIPDTMDTVGQMSTKAWFYCPQTIMLNGLYVVELMKDTMAGQTPNEQLLDTGDFKSLYISFPYVTEDTFQYWDIKDYLENPTIRRGNQNWGRIGDPAKSLNDARTGVVVRYIDEFGEEWSTDNDPNFQPFGYFYIDRVTVNNRDIEELASHLFITGHFEARLYNDIGYWKDMRGGKFQLRILTPDNVKLGPIPNK